MWLSRTLLHLIMSELADASGKSCPLPVCQRIMVDEWKLELQECLQFMETNFTYATKMKDIMAKVEETGAGPLLMPLWSTV